MTKPTDVLEPLLSVVDVAKAIKASTKTVHRLIDAGEMPVIRMGKLIRIQPQDLRAFIARCRIG